MTIPAPDMRRMIAQLDEITAANKALKCTSLTMGQHLATRDIDVAVFLVRETLLKACVSSVTVEPTFGGPDDATNRWVTPAPPSTETSIDMTTGDVCVGGAGA